MGLGEIESILSLNLHQSGSSLLSIRWFAETFMGSCNLKIHLQSLVNPLFVPSSIGRFKAWPQQSSTQPAFASSAC